MKAFLTPTSGLVTQEALDKWLKGGKPVVKRYLQSNGINIELDDLAVGESAMATSIIGQSILTLPIMRIH